MKRVIGFFRREAVLSIALVLAVASMFLVKPDAQYAQYIDYDVLMLLFSLMAVVAGLKRCTVFDRISRTLSSKGKNLRILTMMLVLACFFVSMVVTNDVALITFVPLTAGMLADASPMCLIYAVTLETVAANLGSMATPIGNPQNLYLYSHYGMSGGTFAKAVLPIAGASLVLLVISCLLMKKTAVDAGERAEIEKAPKGKLILYAALLVLCVLSVFHVVPKYVCCVAVAVCALAADRKVLLEVDYALLATFACFFVFVGNVSRLPSVSEFLSGIIRGRELEAGILSSQCISNVPAALMLSGFTDDAFGLMRGVNLGGLGTLVASLASLISYKAYMKVPGAKAGKYLAVFTGVNVAFLAVLYGFVRLIA